MSSHFALIFTAALVSSTLAHPQFSRSTIDKVKTNMLSASQKSWEIGTMMEAITELETPQLSVFEAKSVPASRTSKLPSAALKALDKALSQRNPKFKCLIDTSAVGDSASLGVTDVIASVTKRQTKYTQSAEDQMHYLLYSVPHQGVVISHRRERFQAWADFISMAPPFIAYYGAAKGGAQGLSLLQNAYQQCKGYRNILRDPKTGLWRHIMEGSWSDPGLWATGNAWAAFGMLRVQQTLAKSSFARQLQGESADLLAWTEEILAAAWARQQKSGAVKNYMDKSGQFDDSAGTALLAATTYRLAAITGSKKLIPAAEKALKYLISKTDKNGWVKGAVDPYAFDKVGSRSPEAQSFVIMLDAAARKYYSR